MWVNHKSYQNRWPLFWELHQKIKNKVKNWYAYIFHLFRLVFRLFHKTKTVFFAIFNQRKSSQFNIHCTSIYSISKALQYKHNKWIRRKIRRQKKKPNKTSPSLDNGYGLNKNMKEMFSFNFIFACGTFVKLKRKKRKTNQNCFLINSQNSTTKHTHMHSHLTCRLGV